MKFTRSWLARYLDSDADAATIADALTRLGLEVESVSNPATALAPFVIAEVLSAEPHPQADKLQVLSVDAGSGAVQVVCGAPNARAGMKGVFGPPGAQVPGLDLTLKVAAIRGVESRGMMCSSRELGLGEEHDGIMDLAADAPVGVAYAAWAGLDDPLFDVAVTPNRQDCMGVYGIARDLAALGLGTLKPRPAPVLSEAFVSPLRIATEDTEGCPAFLARHVRGVVNGPSPAWLQRLLAAVGQKPISALVDITNYFSIGHGRPLHVYDVATLQGGLTARRARAGESVLALNGKSYALDPSMTVIADDAHVHDIGGIMGGMESGVSEATTEVLIEAAFFAPERIGATGRALGITSDARARFERGVDPAFVAPGLDLATAMVLELCGGEASAMAVAGGVPEAARTVAAYDPGQVARLAGIEVPAEEQRAILERLGFGVSGEARWTVTIPSWRRDVDGGADLVEEVVRLHGLDRVPATPLPRAEGVAKPTATAAQRLERRARRTLASRGLNEAITWSFIAEADAARFGGGVATVENPISAELAVMRPSLLPGLLAAAARNAARGLADVRLFEIGRRYRDDGEHATAALLLAGDRVPRDWRTGKALPFDAFDAKAEVMATLAALGVPVERLGVQAPAEGHYHPGRSARLVLGKAVLAQFGELHPSVTAELRGTVVAGEIMLDALPQRGAKRARAVFAPPALQAVTRDYAFVAPESLSADALLRAVAAADKALIVDVALFDRFSGGSLEPGQVSLGVQVTLQPAAATLTDAQLEAVGAAVVVAAAKLGATLRA
ncbi:phenylalanine--tRNA ligase subunit beta [Sandaracinobacteroides saxicola]|uniref:Phenylalanine--tRNA ligase beta subunit n=1 Tax=Sandaracinobacteroides saxicola TaxID=2759707 RepID=A0A7G5IIB4_9SPHN|nr:phenylalanine--tRNA ligase subunit beta [Sandaracinobacteroides saxicola]QMW23106.1 phenylalanine--tRNA ligase subunit beta [Sandaracinobacteroides saxicola]